MIRHVPITHAKLKIHRNSRSRTIATYFQSSITCNTRKATGTQLNYCYEHRLTPVHENSRPIVYLVIRDPVSSDIQHAAANLQERAASKASPKNKLSRVRLDPREEMCPFSFLSSYPHFFQHFSHLHPAIPKMNDSSLKLMLNVTMRVLSNRVASEILT